MVEREMGTNRANTRGLVCQRNWRIWLFARLSPKVAVLLLVFVT